MSARWTDEDLAPACREPTPEGEREWLKVILITVIVAAILVLIATDTSIR